MIESGQTPFFHGVKTGRKYLRDLHAHARGHARACQEPRSSYVTVFSSAGCGPALASTAASYLPRVRRHGGCTSAADRSTGQQPRVKRRRYMCHECHAHHSRVPLVFSINCASLADRCTVRGWRVACGTDYVCLCRRKNHVATSEPAARMYPFELVLRGSIDIIT